MAIAARLVTELAETDAAREARPGPDASPAAQLAQLAETVWGARRSPARLEVVRREAGPAEEESPFARVWGNAAGRVAPVFKLQYLLDRPGEAALLVGVVSRVWHRPAWLRPAFWLLGRAGILFPDVGRNVPAVMLVRVERDARRGASGGGIRHAWYRTFYFGAMRHFDAQLRYDAGLKRVVERVGIAGMLEVVWNIRPLSGRTIGITTEGMALKVGPLRLWLPRLLYVDVWAIERADTAADDTLHLDLCMTHPLFGPIFGYSGTFQVSQEPSEPADDAGGEERMAW